MKYPTHDIRPLAEVAIDPKFKKLIDAGLIKLVDNRVEFTSGGARISTELTIIAQMATLEPMADLILSEKAKAKKESNDSDEYAN